MIHGKRLGRYVYQGATGLVAGQLAWEAITLCRAVHTARMVLDRSSVVDPVQTPGNLCEAMRLHILVPGLREQAYMTRTVAAFARLAEDCEQVRVWFVTTEREEAEHRGPTTRTLLERELAARHVPRVSILHYPHDTGNKASQLNWALAKLCADAGEPQARRTYVGVFDFDSQPHPQTGSFVVERATQGTPEVIQVVPLNTSTLNGPPNHLPIRAMIGVEAWHHATRSLGVERWKLDRSERERRLAQYIVGAGVFLRLDALRDAGGFPFVDDVPLGYWLFLRGAKFATVPVFNTVDLPGTLSAHLNSLKFIACGVLSWPEALWETMSTPNVTWVDRARLALLGAQDTFEMTAYPWLGLALTPSLVREGPTGRVVAAAFWGLPVIQTTIMRRVLCQRITPKNWAVPIPLIAAASVARRFWRSMGAWRLVVNGAAAAASGGQVKFAKRDRAEPPLAAETATGVPR